MGLNNLKWEILFLTLLLSPMTILSQVRFSDPIVITQNVSRPECVYASDLDGDGDMDVLSASVYDDKVAWYENRDGLGDFGPQRIIDYQTDGPWCVCAADLDDDDDMDVLAAFGMTGDQIVWYENMDGQGGFGDKQIISDQVDCGNCVCTADIDNDGDEDVVSSSETDGKIAWYENTDAQGTFGPQNVISTQTDQPMWIVTSDLDGDENADVLSASFGDHKIAWYENTDGLGGFGPQQVISIQDTCASCVRAADLDGDNDMDILASRSIYVKDNVWYKNTKIVWYENTDGLGSFGICHVITDQVENPWGLYIADLDLDGDMDVLSASMYDDQITWYENTNSLGSFGPKQIITDQADDAECVYASDLDGDEDIDVIFSAMSGNTIAWHRNLLVTDVREGMDLLPRQFNLYQNHPNPFNPSTTIRYNVKNPCRVILKLYDTAGREIATLVDKYQAFGQHETVFDASYLPTGMYVYRIRMGKFQATRKMLILK